MNSKHHDLQMFVLSFCTNQKIEVRPFSKTLKMSPAHLHMVGNAIVKFQ